MMDLAHAGGNGYSSFLRIKVKLNIKMLFKVGIQNRNLDGGLQWVNLRYKWLPDLCVRYGMMGHFSGKVQTIFTINKISTCHFFSFQEKKKKKKNHFKEIYPKNIK